ncbi:PaaI family thioesterase [Aspergillus glaucus CBS 516.65]|uniref:Thioesterase domain-containing protein n=1 Tax=Aspergillus glaucus CBS 516.65 TaxID=1160497 RepID=A0A1L9V4K6_ASPGL|nr:hypothetical protein ASPGLDRAFT_53360 [Aspergillus glaucus CBS 516.65]OJJ78762.1 hypothetical protein ASPGLDRAFT_53360 [Aspergillus glaucus CBS 516.65]
MSGYLISPGPRIRVNGMMWGNQIRRRCFSDRSDFLGQFLESHQPSRAAVNYFSAIDWTRRVLDDRNYEAVPFFSRYLDEQTGENRFFSRTVNTPTTIPHILALRQKGLTTIDTAEPEPSIRLQCTPTPEIQNRRPGVICLMALGPELEAHPSIVHGGFQGVIFDEIMRFVILLHQHNIAHPGPRDIHYTTRMSISYRAPVITPSDVLVRSWLARREGRKWFAEAQIVDYNNKILTSAESMWVTANGAAS